MADSSAGARDYYRRVLEGAPLDRVAEELLGSRITIRRTDGFGADCPGHASKSKTSLSGDYHKGLWLCRAGCGGGDAIDLAEFVMFGSITRKGADGRMTRTHREARDRVAKIAGIEPLSKAAGTAADAEVVEARRIADDSVFLALTKLAAIQRDALLAHEAALAFCHAKWGFNREAVERHWIGLAGAGDWESLAAAGIDARVAYSTGAFRDDSRGHVWPFFDRRIMFPYFSTGRVVYLIGRFAPGITEANDFEKRAKFKKLPVYDENKHSHIARSISNSVLWGEDVIRARPRSVVLTEGVADAIAIQDAGFACISPVTVHLKNDDVGRIVRRLKKAGTEEVLLVLDNEVSGVGLEGALDTARVLERGGVKCRVGLLPLGDAQKKARADLEAMVGAETWAKLETTRPAERMMLLRSAFGDRSADADRAVRLLDDAKIDPAEWFRIGGTPEAFGRVIDAARAPIEIGLESVKPNENKVELVKTIAGLLASVATLGAIEQDEALKAIKKRTQISIGALRDEMRRAAKASGSTKREPRRSNRGVDSDPDGEARPRILVSPGRLPQVVDEIDAALATQRKFPLYRHGSSLVEIIVREWTPKRDDKPAETSLSPHRIDHHRVADIATRAADFVRLDQKGEETPLDCPDRVARTLLSRAGRWSAPILVGVVECPTIRADGSLLIEPGYDAASGLYLDSGSLGAIEVPEEPTHEDAKTALTVILHPLRDFPFVEEGDRAAAAAASVSAIVRRVLPNCPGFGFSSPVRGTGKTTVAKLPAWISTGRDPAVEAWTDDEPENRKALLATLISGAPIALFDNVECAVRSASLCAVLTSASYRGRLLGESRIVEAPTNALFIFTGCNLTIEGDLTRRVVPCEIDALEERPEERRFAGNLRDEVRRDRPRLVQAALTLLRAHFVAGRPQMGLVPFGSFDEWSSTVRAALVWAGMRDPCAGRDRLRRHDPAVQQLRALLVAWNEIFGAKPVGVAELCRTKSSLSLLDALAEIGAGEEDRFNSRKVGRYLLRNDRRIVGGLRIERCEGDRNGSALWRVVAMPPPVRDGEPAVDRDGGFEGFGGFRGFDNPLRERSEEKDPDGKSVNKEGNKGAARNPGNPGNPETPGCDGPRPESVANGHVHWPAVSPAPAASDPPLPKAPCATCGSYIFRDPHGDGRWCCDRCCSAPRSAAGADSLWAVADGRRDPLGPFSDPADADAAAAGSEIVY